MIRRLIFTDWIARRAAGAMAPHGIGAGSPVAGSSAITSPWSEYARAATSRSVRALVTRVRFR